MKTLINTINIQRRERNPFMKIVDILFISSAASVERDDLTVRLAAKGR